MSGTKTAAERFTAAIIATGLPVADLAKRIKAARSRIYAWRQGEIEKITVPHLLELGRLSGRHPYYLYYGKGNPDGHPEALDEPIRYDHKRTARLPHRQRAIIELVIEALLEFFETQSKQRS